MDAAREAQIGVVEVAVAEAVASEEGQAVLAAGAHEPKASGAGFDGLQEATDITLYVAIGVAADVITEGPAGGDLHDGREGPMVERGMGDATRMPEEARRPEEASGEAMTDVVVGGAVIGTSHEVRDAIDRSR